ncbi:MAG: plasmid pRiA4b ORF-3 family protein [Synergistaceae bacterium]|jgi:hypothetical protein|nr:plasmid pRiA4b ORF-3 family protein [Synergistaceae bacterium]
MARHPIYQFYTELDGYKPIIWRRFQVGGGVSMARLAYILMTMFEMKANHLFAVEMLQDEEDENLAEDTTPEFNKIYRFEILNGETDAEQDDRLVLLDATEHTLFRTFSASLGRLAFIYDFGDDWRVFLTLEKVFRDKNLSDRELPRVLEGAGYGIVEDCGGISGLEELVRAFKKQKGKAYKEFSKWLETDNFNISAFDIDDMNFRLKKVPRIYAELYERSIAPTKQSVDLLERKYLKKRKKVEKTVNV